MPSITIKGGNGAPIELETEFVGKAHSVVVSEARGSGTPSSVTLLDGNDRPVELLTEVINGVHHLSTT